MKNTNVVVRFLSVVLYSKLFFLTSCTTGTWFGGEALSHWHARGDTPRFVQAIVMNDGEMQYLSSKTAVDHFTQVVAAFGADAKEADLPFTFLLTQNGGTLEIDEFTRVKFTVKELNNGVQEIVVLNIDDDYTRESIYHAERYRITPIYSRVFGVGHVMAAWPYALVLSLILYGIGWLLKKRRSASA